MNELATLFIQLDETVQAQEPIVEQVENQTHEVNDNTTKAIGELDQGIVSARRRNRLKWWTLLVVVLIIAVLALVLGLYFGLKNN